MSSLPAALLPVVQIQADKDAAKKAKADAKAADKASAKEAKAAEKAAAKESKQTAKGGKKGKKVSSCSWLSVQASALSASAALLPRCVAQVHVLAYRWVWWSSMMHIGSADRGYGAAHLCCWYLAEYTGRPES